MDFKGRREHDFILVMQLYLMHSDLSAIRLSDCGGVSRIIHRSSWNYVIKRESRCYVFKPHMYWQGEIVLV